jgi:hypothetical protein
MKIEIDSETIVFANKIHRFDPVEQEALDVTRKTREQLEASLYAWGEEVASNALEVHISNLRKKLPKDFIKTIRGVGYSVSPP